MASIVPVWVLALAAAIVVAAATTGRDFYTWLPITMGAIIIVTFLVQLSLRRKEGFFGRLALSTGGALVILAVTTLALELAR